MQSPPLCVILLVVSFLLLASTLSSAATSTGGGGGGGTNTTKTAAPLSPVFEFFDILARKEYQERVGMTLAIDCDQGYDPCKPNGVCSPAGSKFGRCVCASEPKAGYWSGDDCKECDIGWSGADCKVECKGGSCNRCNNHGVCSEGVAGDGSCVCQQDQFGFWDGVDCSVCKAGYFGDNCDKSCPGAEFGQLPCWGRGECQANEAGEGYCVCDSGWGSAHGCSDCDHASYGPNCIAKCDGYIEVNDTSVVPAKLIGLPCRGHGKCFNGTSANGTCMCDPSYGTFDCGLQCPGNGCSGHGTCNDGARGDATCNCDLYWSPPACSICVANRTGWNCQTLCPLNPDINSPLYGVPCSGNGKCVYINNESKCECTPGFGGPFCEMGCMGPNSTSQDFPCNGRGKCHPNNNTCECFQNDVDGYWTGAYCDRCDVRYNNSYNCNKKCPATSLAGVLAVCNGHGTCWEGACICDRATAKDPFEYCGTACDTISIPNEVDANLNCVKCTCVYCTDAFASGDCVSGQCPAIVDRSGQQFACNGNGRCVEGRGATGECKCYAGFAGEGCGYECPSSYGQPCGGWARGICNSTTDKRTGTTTHRCDCRDGFAGKACELECPRYNDAPCSGHGTCNGTADGNAKCVCFPGWTGKDCSVTCQCNLWNGVCDIKECGDYKPMDICYTCKCFGNYTGLCNDCIDGVQGRRCEGLCINGNTTGKICKCAEHWSGPACDIPCPRDYTPAENICGKNGVCEWGHDKPGTCRCNPGWYGLNCTSQCRVEDCVQNRSLVNAQCNRLTGACECLNDESGHWAGAACTECAEGFFGQHCEQRCQCSDHGSCDKDTGECQCFQSPLRGFYSGQQCDACTPGYIGSNCERRAVAYTRQKVNMVGAPFLEASKVIYGGVPSTEVSYMDERLEKLYAGGFPLAMFDANLSTPGTMRKINQSSTKYYNVSLLMPDGNESVRECYDEVAYVFVHENFVYFLMHPQMQCNMTARLLRQDRRSNELNLTAAQLVWAMPYPSTWSRCIGCGPWGNRTTRVVCATSLTKQVLAGEVGSGDSTKPPLLAFLLGEPKLTQAKAFEPSHIVVRIDVALVVNPATRALSAWALYLDDNYEMIDIKLRHKTELDVAHVLMLSGKLQATSTFDTWEVLLFNFDTALGFFPLQPAEASLRKQVSCWPKASDPLGLQSKKCDLCSTVVRASFGKDRSLILAVNHPETVFIAWVRYFADVRQDMGGSTPFNAVIRDKCEAARYNSGDFSVTGLVTGITTKVLPKMIVSVASATAPGTDVVSLAYDETVQQAHLCLTVYSLSSMLVKFTFQDNKLSILGTRTLGFVSQLTVAGTRAMPEVFEQMLVDSHARVLYCLQTAVTPLQMTAFLLYDALTVTPNIADQRGGTTIVVNGTGFKRIFLPLPPPIETPRFTPRCLFSNGDQVDSTALGPNGIVCVTTAISEKDVAGSCGVQQVEVSLFGGTWFTENLVDLRRVRAAKIDGQVNPVRGPLRGTLPGEYITFVGTGFVDSQYAVCKFFSNNTDTSINKPLLYSKLEYVSPNEARCTQPATVYPSPDYAFLDVSLDGQLFMETTPPFYTIVGVPTNLSAPALITVKADRLSPVTIPVRIVDELNHWVGDRGDIDAVSRPICIPQNLTTTMPCVDQQYPWRVLGDGYPWPICRPNWYMLSSGQPHCRWTNATRGGITFADIVLVEPRVGDFLLRSIVFDLDRRWRTEVLLRIVPGDGVALALSNREAILDRPSFVPNVPLSPAPEVIVLDRLGNKVENPPASLEVFATTFWIYDNNQSTHISQSFSRKKAPDSETVRFPAIFLEFIHGVTHYVNFTSQPSLQHTVSPALRTALCENPDRSYKVALDPEGLCKPCPPEGARCNGTETIVVLPGYWRGDSPTDIYKCRASEEICQGGKCAEGYHGTLCSLCERGWGKVGSTKCAQCPPVGSSIAIISVTAFFLIVALTGWTINILRQAQVTDLAIILRTVVNHMQATGKLGEFSTQWDPFLKGVFDIQNSASGLSFSGLSSLSCIISDLGADYEAIFIAYMALPALTVPMTGLVLGTVRLLQLRPVLTDKLREDVIEEVKNMPSARIGVLLNKYPWYMVATTTVSIFMFTLYQTLITQATAVLNCREFTIAPGKTQQYLAVDMSINCTDTGDHRFKTAAYIAAVAYGVGIPSAFVFGFKTVLQALGNKDLVNMMFQFLIGGYKPELWFWQAVIMVRKLVLVLVITFIGDNPQLQSYGGMWTMSIALVLQIWFNPNERDVFNRVEALSLAIITITLNLGLLYFWKDMPSFGKNVLTAFLILVTLGVIVMFAYYMYEPIKDTVGGKLKQMRGLITEYINKPKEEEQESGLNIRDMEIKVAPRREEGVSALHEFQGEGRLKPTGIVAEFDELEELGIVGPASHMAAPSASGRRHSGAPGVRRQMPIISETELRHMDTDDL